MTINFESDTKFIKLLARTENVLTWCKEIRTTKCLISFEVHWYRKSSKNSYPGRLLKTDRVSALKGASLSSLCSNGNSDVTKEFETRSARCDALKSEPSSACRLELQVIHLHKQWEFVLLSCLPIPHINFIFFFHSLWAPLCELTSS